MASEGQYAIHHRSSRVQRKAAKRVAEHNPACKCNHHHVDREANRKFEGGHGRPGNLEPKYLTSALCHMSIPRTHAHETHETTDKCTTTTNIVPANMPERQHTALNTPPGSTKINRDVPPRMFSAPLALSLGLGGGGGGLRNRIGCNEGESETAGSRKTPAPIVA